MGNVVEFTPVGGLKGGGGREGQSRTEILYRLLLQNYCSNPPHPNLFPPPRGFPKSTLWKYIYKKSCKKEKLLLSVVHLGNDSDAGLSFLYQ